MLLSEHTCEGAQADKPTQIYMQTQTQIQILTQIKYQVSW